MRIKVNNIGPTFPTFYTPNSETKPDCVLTNNNFYLNYHIQSAGLGPSDHTTMDIFISAEPIVTLCSPSPDENNTNWEEYKNILAQIPEINLDGQNALDLHQEFSKIIDQITQAKTAVTPQKLFIKKKLKNHSKI